MRSFRMYTAGNGILSFRIKNALDGMYCARKLAQISDKYANIRLSVIWFIACKNWQQSTLGIYGLSVSTVSFIETTIKYIIVTYTFRSNYSNLLTGSHRTSQSLTLRTQLHCAQAVLVLEWLQRVPQKWAMMPHFPLVLMFSSLGKMLVVRFKQHNFGLENWAN
jgi:hypothetical protein